MLEDVSIDLIKAHTPAKLVSNHKIKINVLSDLRILIAFTGVQNSYN